MSAGAQPFVPNQEEPRVLVFCSSKAALRLLKVRLVFSVIFHFLGFAMHDTRPAYVVVRGGEFWRL